MTDKKIEGKCGAEFVIGEECYGCIKTPPSTCRGCPVYVSPAIETHKHLYLRGWEY